MAEIEEWDEDAGECPCGAGKLIMNTRSYENNGYQRSDKSWRIACEKCIREWHIEGKVLTLKSSEEASKQSREDFLRTKRDIDALFSKEVDVHFSSLALKSKQAEWNELKKLGLTHLSLSNYRELRKRGLPISAAASDRSDRTWLKTRVPTMADGETVIGMLEKEERLKAAHQEAERKIIRRKIEGQ